MKLAALLAPLLFLPLAHAVIIGTDSFEYPDGAIAGKLGGQLWNYKNTSPTGYSNAPSNWDAVNGTPVVTAGKLVTSGNQQAKREYRGNTETEGAVNDANLAKKVYYKVTVTTGPTVSPADYFGISSLDFNNEKIYFGKRGGSTTFGLEEVGVFGTNGSVTIQPNTTYVLVAQIDYTNNFVRLLVNPDLNALEPSGSGAGSFSYTGTNWSTAVRFAAGTAVSWDDLVVCTEWEDLATVTVSTTADEDNGSLGGGAGVSLREAVTYARAGQRIVFSAGLSGQTINLTHPGGDILIPQAAEIDATSLSGGLTVSGNNTSRHFDVPTSKFLTLRGLTLTRGNGSGNVGGFGGSILNSGTLNLFRCILSGNGSSNDGGAVYSYSTGTLQATDSTIFENTAGNAGGGIMVSGSGTAELTRCTFSGSSGSLSGAFWMQGNTATLSHCTIAGNRSTGGFTTGGIACVGGTLNLQHCTISQNTGNQAGGGLFLQTGATVNVANCIIAGNADTSDRSDITYNGGGTLNASGTNLIGTNTTVTTQFPATPNLIGTGAAPVDAKLSPLGHFGGLVQTMHPLIGSPAIDAIVTSNPGGTDARGFLRFVDGNASFSTELDIGAVEAGPLRTVDAVGELSLTGLRATIITSTEPGARIAFSNALFPATTIPSFGALSIPSTAKGLFIDASNLSGPVTVSGGNASNVFSIDTGATAALHSLRIINGNSFGGGGIINGGTCTLIACTVSGNTTSGLGGGIRNLSATCLVIASTLSGNSAHSGGGIHSIGTCTVISSTLSGNTATSSGGGISSSSGTCAILSSTLSGNTAPGGTGGGIENSGTAIFRLTSSIVAGNTGANIAGTLTTNTNNFTGGDPRLAPLGDYGGRTQTLRLLSDSPLRDAATASGRRTDQRGFPLFGLPDIGAYEAQLGSIANVSIKANTSSSALPFTVGQIGTLTATSGNPTLIPNSGLVLGGSGANRTITCTPAANQFGSALITVTNGLSGETTTFTLTVTALQVTTLADTLSPGSLRQALADAADSPDPDLIVFAPILSGQTILLGGQLNIPATANGLFIDASNLSGPVTISGQGNSRVFNIASGATVAMHSLRIVNGKAADGSGGDGQGGGGILNAGSLSLFACSVTGNRSGNGSSLDGIGEAGGNGGSGGGISSSGPLTLTACTVSGNTTGNGGTSSSARGGSGGNGGGISSSGPLTLTSCTLFGNRAGNGERSFSGNSANFGFGGSGGGIFSSGSLSLTACTFSGNAAGIGSGSSFVGGGGGSGGGIFSSGSLSLTACTFSGNAAGNGGGGGFPGFGGGGGGGGSGGGIFSSGSLLSLTACTFSGNAAGNGGDGNGGRNSGGSGGGGGGIFSSGSVSLTACTIAGNQTGNGGNGDPIGSTGLGGGISGGNAILENCLIAENTLPNGTQENLRVSSLTYLGANLLGTAANLTATGPAPIINPTPLLAPLGDYGGPTLTMPPLPGSPAIDAANTSTRLTDQRGLPMNGMPDIGAAENQGTTDLRLFWNTDGDGDGNAFGVEHALGTNAGVADRASPRNLSAPAFTPVGQASMTFGRNTSAAPGTISVLKRSTDLITFTEVFRITGNSPVPAFGISALINTDSITILDSNPPPGKAFYRIEAISP